MSIYIFILVHMKTKLISVGSLKGGVGKSTITSLIANYIHLKTDKTICVVDCDDRQKTLSFLRQTDLDSGFEEDDLYDLIPALDPKKFPKIYIDALKGNYDYVLVDLPGNTRQNGVVACYVMVDSLFIPTSSSMIDIHSLTEFLDDYNEIIDQRKASGFGTFVCGFFNKIDTRMNSFKEIYRARNLMRIPFMKSFIPEKKSLFADNVSTAKAYKDKKNSIYLTEFCEEMFELIKTK